ncbi:unnamed protein product [Clonostachys byssicola]|uniref:FMN hydroxy acid dehydrogenase domain-containing protein n=1 Tax=Clonostachys byssicola TaxID=160290 RepID=A0A9N9U798_9HYPO|nr:unnamed protein product [Clonostachys byssicola]
MRSLSLMAPLAGVALAARATYDVVDTGYEKYLSENNWSQGTLPDLKTIQCLDDLEFAAKQGMTPGNWSHHRMAAGQEWGLKNNLEIWDEVKFRPRFFRDTNKLQDNLGIELFGYNFSVPFFISPAGSAIKSNAKVAELDLVRAAGDENFLYIPSLYTSKSKEEIASVRRNNTLNGQQVLFQQIYTKTNISETYADLQKAEALGFKALVVTVDSPGDGVNLRTWRYSHEEYFTSNFRPNNWELFQSFRNYTSLPIVAKGISTVEQALEAVEHGLDGIYLSNHGGRQLEHANSPLEVAYEIYRNAPEIFEKVTVMADSGVRSGSDVLKLMALGVKAVGVGRPFYYSNVYGYDGIVRAATLLKNEIIYDGWNVGINSLSDLDPSILDLNKLATHVHLIEKN